MKKIYFFSCKSLRYLKKVVFLQTEDRQKKHNKNNYG